MSFESQITQQVANLTNRLNTITTQAKKIFQLPPQTSLNPASEIHVTIGGISQKINVQQIVDAILSFRQNQLVSIGTITVLGNDLTIPANAQWIINNINYFNPSDIIINVPYAADGYTRSDILVADTNNDIIRIVGSETEGISPTPNVPLNTVLVTTISVTDSTIGNTLPVIGTDFELLVNKQNSLVADGTGKKYATVDAINTANFLQNLQRVLELGETAEDVGIQLTSSTESSTLILDNETVKVENGTSNISIWAHVLTEENVTEIIQYLSNSIIYTDKTTPTKQTKLWLFRTAAGFAEFFVNPNKPSGSYTLATTDEVDLKLNIADYNDRFKGVYLTEAALISARPTGSAGDYAQVNETGSTDVVNYNWDAEENIWVEGGSGGSGATNTDTLPEGSSNLYFTTARVLATVLSGISFSTGSPIVSTDSVLVAFGKIQKQITDLSTIYQAILTDVNFGTFINGLTGKTTPINADSISIVDSADSNKQKKVSLTNFKAFLKTYFDTLYISSSTGSTSILLFDSAVKTPLTGTTAQTLIATYAIPANTIPANCLMRLICRSGKTGTAGNFTVTISLGTTAGVGVILANGVSSGPSTNLSMLFEKHPVVSGGNVKVLNVTGNFPSDIGVSSSPGSTYAFNPAIAQNIYVLANISNAADTFNFEYLAIEIIK